MFNRKKKEQRLLEQIAMIRPTSKSELKRTCLMLSNMNIAKAREMYDFLIDGMEGIPDVEPAAKSFIQNFGEQAGSVLGWLRDNQDMIGQGVDFIKGIMSKRGAAAAAKPLPPING